MSSWADALIKQHADLLAACIAERCAANEAGVSATTPREDNMLSARCRTLSSAVQ